MNTKLTVAKSTPLPLRAIFHEYFNFGNRITKHYLSPKVFLGFGTGTFVPPLHRKNLYGLQYSQLPAKRVGIVELWNRLKAAQPKAKGTYGSTGTNGTIRKGLPNNSAGRRPYY